MEPFVSRLDWSKLDRSPIGREFRSLTKELLKLRSEKIVPMVKKGIVEARYDLFGQEPNGGLAVRWTTAQGDILQIVTNFAGRPLPRRMLVLLLVSFEKKLALTRAAVAREHATVYEV